GPPSSYTQTDISASFTEQEYADGLSDRYYLYPDPADKLYHIDLSVSGNLRHGDQLLLYSGLCSGDASSPSVSGVSDVIWTGEGDMDQETPSVQLGATENCVFLVFDTVRSGHSVHGYGFTCQYEWHVQAHTYPYGAGTIASTPVAFPQNDVYIMPNIDWSDLDSVAVTCTGSGYSATLSLYTGTCTGDGASATATGEHLVISQSGNLDLRSMPTIPAGDDCAYLRWVTEEGTDDTQFSCDFVWGTSVSMLDGTSGTFTNYQGYYHNEDIKFIAYPDWSGSSLNTLSIQCTGSTGNSDYLSVYTARCSTEGDTHVPPVTIEDAVQIVSEDGTLDFSVDMLIRRRGRDENLPNCAYVSWVTNGMGEYYTGFECTYEWSFGWTWFLTLLCLIGAALLCCIGYCVCIRTKKCKSKGADSSELLPLTSETGGVGESGMKGEGLHIACDVSNPNRMDEYETEWNGAGSVYQQRGSRSPSMLTDVARGTEEEIQINGW
ncbi:hypothetical protein KIPB_005186, partial [Kipferlia bialata]